MLKNVGQLMLVMVFFAAGAGFADGGKFTPPLSDRVKTNIDFGWRFYRGDINGEEETHQVNERPWQRIQLPHEWSIEGPFDREHNTTQGFLPMEIGWYRKGLHFPESDADRKIYIIFDGVYRESDVWMNYAYLGHHTSGYTSFVYDLTGYVRTGDTTPNGLRVRVDGRRHEQDMYEGTGIYRHVWIVVTNKLHVANWGTFVSTPNVSDKSATVRIQTKMKNDYASRKNFQLKTVLVDAAGKKVAEVASDYSLPANSEQEFTQEIALENPHRWDLDDPYLYHAHSIISLDNEVVDTYKTRFGIRTIRFDANKGFFLNEKPVKLRGFNAHYDLIGLGTAIPDRIHRDQMLAMKQAGFNLFRSSHNPATPERLDVCDEIGMLVWDEIERKLESKEIELPLVRDTITRDRNHPSIILWSLENESPLESTTIGAEIIRAGTELAHQLDPTRPTTFAASMPVNKRGYGAAADVVSYNYHWERADQDHLDFPDWKIGLISEYSAKRTNSGVYGISDKFDLYGGEVVSIYTACTSVEGYWKRIRARDYLGGGCIWAGIDYWGEAVKWPLARSGYGIIDMCMTPKAHYYYFVSQYTQEPMLHIFPHWTWPGLEGREIDVWGYTNCDEVELFLNGKSLGSQSRPLDLTPYQPIHQKDLPPEKRSHRYFENPAHADAQVEHLAWKVPYQPGSLKAVARKNGKVVVTQEIHTAGKPAQIRLERYMTPYLTEMTPLVADGRDVIVVKATILDANGVRVSDDPEVTFSVSGGPEIVGVGNPDIASHEPRRGNQIRAFNGYCAVVVKSSRQPGEFQITAEAAGLSAGTLSLNSIAPKAERVLIEPMPKIPVRREVESIVYLKIVDHFGEVIPSARDEISLTLEGPAAFSGGGKTKTFSVEKGQISVDLKYLAPGPLKILAAGSGGLRGLVRMTVN